MNLPSKTYEFRNVAVSLHKDKDSCPFFDIAQFYIVAMSTFCAWFWSQRLQQWFSVTWAARCESWIESTPLEFLLETGKDFNKSLCLTPINEPEAVRQLQVQNVCSIDGSLSEDSDQ